MKTIIVVALGLLIVGGIVYFSNTGFSQVYKAEVVEKYIEIDKTPEELKDCPECMQAAQDVKRRLELEAELKQLNLEIDERQLRADEIEKELGTY